MNQKKALSRTPRKNSEHRKVDFSLIMREKFSENWMEIRKKMKPKKKHVKKKASKKAKGRKPKVT